MGQLQHTCVQLYIHMNKYSNVINVDTCRNIEANFLTCVDHRLREEGEACLEKFLAKRGFSRELRQYGGNLVVPRLGISKHAHYCKRECDTIFVIFLLRCLKPLLPCSKDFPLFVLSQPITHTPNSFLWLV